MKIAIFRTDSSIVRPESYNSQEIGLARGLAEQGHSVDIYSLSESGTVDTLSLDNLPGVRFTYLPAYLLPVLDVPIYKDLNLIFTENKYDLVQINEEGSLASLHIALRCKRFAIPFCIYQGMYSDLSGRARTAYEVLHHRTVRPWLKSNSHKVFSKTSQARKYLLDKGYMDVDVVGVGLDAKPFDDAEEFNWHANLGIDTSTPVILYVGSVEVRRNPDLLLDIALRLTESAHMVVVGGGPEFDRISDRIENEKICNVSLLGKLPQKKLPSLYRSSAILLLPSTYEIFGMVVLESLWFGVPVLSTRTAGPTDILTDTSHGEIIDSLDLEVWVSAIEERLAMAHDDITRVQIENYARRHFHWGAIGETYLSRLGTLR